MVNIEIITETIKYIETNLDKPLMLEKVADALGYSSFYLHRIFTKTVDLTIHEYIQRRRLTEAAKLLVFTKKPIVEIAMQAGYQSQQAFSMIFKSMYKFPPFRFRENGNFYPLQIRFEFDEATLRANLKNEWNVKQMIVLAREEDIPDWMNLLRLVIDGFPCLNESAYAITLKSCIAKKSAFIMRISDIVTGAMIISYQTGSIDFLGIHPLYRNRGIMSVLLNDAINKLVAHKQIFITTFREGDKADTGYRSLLKELGFVEGKLLVEFGYPTQQMILTIK